MASTTNLNIRTDQEIKNQSEKIFSELGLTMTTAVNMFLRATIREKGIPFSLKLEVPNAETVAAIEEGRRIANDPNVKGYTSMDDLKSLFEELADAGMETPVALNMEDWSLGGHYLTLVYEQQGTDLDTAEKYIRSLADGSEKIEDNDRFNSLFDTFDLLMQYNSNRDDPLAADYSMNAADFAEGDIAFWFNGNWAWAETSEYYEDGTELGIMPVPQNDTDNNANDWLAGSASKHVMVDTVDNDEQQQAAALNFLNWLANTDEGNKVLVEDCSLVPAFSNIEADATNGLAQSVKDYAADGKLFPGVIDYPGDHWSTLGASMQNYLGGTIDRAELAKEIDDYWTSQTLDPWED